MSFNIFVCTGPVTCAGGGGVIVSVTFCDMFPSVLQLTQEDERLCHSSVGPISQFSKHSWFPGSDGINISV